MNVLCFYLSGPVDWRLRIDTPILLPNASIQSRSVVNPAVYDRIPEGRQQGRRPTLIAADAVFVSSALLVLAAPDETEVDIRSAMESVVRFLRRLRFESGQGPLPDGIISCGGPYQDEAIDGELVWQEPAEFSIRSHVVQWSITEEHVSRACGSIDEAVPTHYGLLLDAPLHHM